MTSVIFIFMLSKVLVNVLLVINDNEIANRRLKGMHMRKRTAKNKLESEIGKNVVEYPEVNPWTSGFASFKRRIDEQLQINGYSEGFVDDEDLLPFYRMGESETYVLAALGCTMP